MLSLIVTRYDLSGLYPRELFSFKNGNVGGGDLKERKAGEESEVSKGGETVVEMCSMREEI